MSSSENEPLGGDFVETVEEKMLDAVADREALLLVNLGLVGSSIFLLFLTVKRSNVDGELLVSRASNFIQIQK
jgi:hypothetical protein